MRLGLLKRSRCRYAPATLPASCHRSNARLSRRNRNNRERVVNASSERNAFDNRSPDFSNEWHIVGEGGEFGSPSLTHIELYACPRAPGLTACSWKSMTSFSIPDDSERPRPQIQTDVMSHVRWG